MIDFIFAVDDPVAWHRKNLQKNPEHYSALRILGPKGITWVQDRIGAGVYYNTLVRCEKRVCMGIIIICLSLVTFNYCWLYTFIAFLNKLLKSYFVIHFHFHCWPLYTWMDIILELIDWLIKCLILLGGTILLIFPQRNGMLEEEEEEKTMKEIWLLKDSFVFVLALKVVLCRSSQTLKEEEG